MARPGPGKLQVLETPYGALSAIICWDADYPDVVSQTGRDDVDLLFVSSNDWDEIENIHARMAVFRAVENGVPLVRQDGTGVSLVADAYGRELSDVDKSDGVLEQDVLVPLNATGTLYPDIRDTFGLAAVLGFVAIVIVTLLKGRADRWAGQDHQEHQEHAHLAPVDH